jgi:hypothetical protein
LEAANALKLVAETARLRRRFRDGGYRLSERLLVARGGVKYATDRTGANWRVCLRARPRR